MRGSIAVLPLMKLRSMPPAEGENPEPPEKPPEDSPDVLNPGDPDVNPLTGG
jgi:hypothetical protein